LWGGVGGGGGGGGVLLKPFHSKAIRHGANGLGWNVFHPSFEDKIRREGERGKGGWRVTSIRQMPLEVGGDSAYVVHCYPGSGHRVWDGVWQPRGTSMAIHCKATIQPVTIL